MDPARTPNQRERDALAMLTIKPVITSWKHRVFSRLWRSGWAKTQSALAANGKTSTSSLYVITEAGQAALERARAA